MLLKISGFKTIVFFMFALILILIGASYFQVFDTLGISDGIPDSPAILDHRTDTGRMEPMNPWISKITVIAFFVLIFWFASVGKAYSYTSYSRGFTCPVCKTGFEASQTASMYQRGTFKDFCYNGAIGNFYGDLIVSCPSCHYAAYNGDFEKEVSDEIKNLVLGELKTKMPGKDLDEDTECEFAAQILIWKNAKNLPIANAYLFGSYLLRYAAEDHLERRKTMQRRAIEYFSKAIDEGELMEESRTSYTYLIGDLYRRLGDFSSALSWYEKARQEKNQPDWLPELLEEQIQMAESKDDDNTV